MTKKGNGQSYNWLPLSGEYEIKDNLIKFKGKEVENENDNLKYIMIGNLLCDQYFDSGKISAEIKFTNAEEEQGCDIIFNFMDRDNKVEFTSIGINKSRYSLFELKRFKDGKWEFLQFRGTGDSLKANEFYNVEIEYIGNRVNMKVNGVQVIDYALPYSTLRSQVGIWCRSKSLIEIKNYHIEFVEPKVFVIMQFSDQFNELYNDVIRPVCADYGFDVVRADDMYNNGLIINDIVNSITESKIVIADITPLNPNVYYEVGYSHALQKSTILMAEEGRELPFDIKPFRVIFYKNTINGKSKVEQSLRSHLDNLI